MILFFKSVAVLGMKLFLLYIKKNPTTAALSFQFGMLIKSLYLVSWSTEAKSSILICDCFFAFAFLGFFGGGVSQLPLWVSLHIRKSEKMGFLLLSRYTHLAILMIHLSTHSLREQLKVLLEGAFKGLLYTDKHGLLLGCSRTQSDWDWQKSSPEWIFPVCLIRSPGKQGSDNHVHVTMCTLFTCPGSPCFHFCSWSVPLGLKFPRNPLYVTSENLPSRNAWFLRHSTFMQTIINKLIFFCHAASTENEWGLNCFASVSYFCKEITMCKVRLRGREIHFKSILHCFLLEVDTK